MNQITVQRLIEILLENKEKTFELQLEGIINLTMEIEQAKIVDEVNYITILNAKKEEQKVSLNTHQIMKIEKVDFNDFEIKFDFLQIAKIKIKK